MIKKIIFLLLFSLISCGKETDLFHDRPEIPPSIPGSQFYLSNDETMIEKFGVVKKIDLRELIPHLSDLSINPESFWYIQKELEIEAQGLATNYAVLKKDIFCLVEIGYCEAYLINRLRR